jgi:sugar/nucleoside kinase (ribokinase family)
MLVCTLGDLALDVIVRLRQPLAPGADANSWITIGAGGQAANVAAWVASLGERSRLIGIRAADDAGTLAASLVAAHGVELVGPTVGSGGGVIVSLVDPSGQRTMCPDRGAAVELHPEHVDPASLAGCDWLHLSGYALFVEPARQAALRAAALARASGTRVSVDLASWSGIRDVGRAQVRADLTLIEPAVVFGNEDEDRALGGPVEGPRWVVKLGAGGCTFDGERRSAVAAPEIVDTTGAGDAFAAGWLVGGPQLALDTAARCVGHAGSMPPLAR